MTATLSTKTAALVVVQFLSCPKAPHHKSLASRAGTPADTLQARVVFQPRALLRESENAAAGNLQPDRRRRTGMHAPHQGAHKNCIVRNGRLSACAAPGIITSFIISDLARRWSFVESFWRWMSPYIISRASNNARDSFWNPGSIFCLDREACERVCY